MKKLFKSALLCLFRALLFSPVPLLLGALLPGASQLSAGLFYGAGQLLGLGVSLVPVRGRIAALIVGALAYVLAGVWALNAIAAPIVLVIVGLCAVGYLFTARACARGDYDPRLMIAGAILHAGAPVAITLSGAQVEYTAMMWCGILFLAMCPYVMNAQSVREGMSLRGRGGKPLKRISRANRVLVTGMLVIALLIASAETIRNAAQRAGSFVMYWVGQFIMWIMNLFISDSEIGSGTGGGSQDMGLGLESAEPSWFALFMEQVMKYLVVVILAVGAVFVLYKLGKMSVRLWRRVSEWARRFAQGVKEDYLEEREQIMDWGEVRGELVESMRDALKRLTYREKKWGELNARERVRFAVRQLYRKRGAGVSGLECLSVRQALGEMGLDAQAQRELGELYDRARYSDHDISDAQAESARRAAKL